MLTRDERRALVFLAVVTVAGGAARSLRPAAGTVAPEQAGVIAPHLAAGDVVRQAALSRQAQDAARPLAPGEKVDVEHATAEQLQRLPRIGRRLALRIVADRAERGPFGSLAGLARVPGLGQGVLAGLAPWATFGGVSAAVGSAAAEALPRRLASAGATPPASGTGVACGDSARVAINRAARAALECLPGIGPVLAERIIAERNARGPFRDAADLKRVKGLGTSRIDRLRPRITVP